MTEEKLESLFLELKNEQPSTSTQDVADWILTASSVSSKKSSFGKKILFIVFIILLGLIMWFVFGLKNTTSRSSDLIKKETEEVIHTASSQHQVVSSETQTFDDIKKDEKSIHEEIIVPEMIILDSSISVQEENNIQVAEPIYFEPQETINTANFIDSNVVIQDVLYILDSTNLFKSPKRFKMDDPDCYLQIINGYAVLSYKFRGVTYFGAGTIHRGEKQIINGHTYSVYAFQCDNRFPVLNMGQRVYFGVREIDVENNKYEVILCSQVWAPTRIIVSHLASEQERKKLEERSKSQR